MVLNASFPTGDPSGLPIADTRRVLGGLIVRDRAGVPRLGILPRNTTPLVTATSTMAYSVAAFEAVTSRTGAGVELVVNDGAVTVPTTASPSANSRIDVVWVRARFSASGDTSDGPEFGVTQGPVGATPVKPAIPAGALELATITIPSTAVATNSSGVVFAQTAQYTALNGGSIVFRTIAQRDAWAALDQQRCSVLATGLEYRLGTNGWELATVVPDIVLRRVAQQLNTNGGTVTVLGDGFGVFGAPQSSLAMSLNGQTYSNDFFEWNRQTGQLKIKIAGYYDVRAHMQYLLNTAGTMVFQVVKNGTTAIGRSDLQSNALALPWARLSSEANLFASGDVLTVLSATSGQGGSLAMANIASPSSAELSVTLRRYA